MICEGGHVCLRKSPENAGSACDEAADDEVGKTFVIQTNS